MLRVAPVADYGAEPGQIFPVLNCANPDFPFRIVFVIPFHPMLFLPFVCPAFPLDNILAEKKKATDFPGVLLFFLQKIGGIFLKQKMTTAECLPEDGFTASNGFPTAWAAFVRDPAPRTKSSNPAGSADHHSPLLRFQTVRVRHSAVIARKNPAGLRAGSKNQWFDQ